jgi:hypothetical protein
LLVGWIGPKKATDLHLLVLAEPRLPIPPEMFSSLLGEFAARREQYIHCMESFEFLVGGGGGFGAINTPDKVSLDRIMVNYPFTPFSETTV